MRSFSFKVKTGDWRAAFRVGLSVAVPLVFIYYAETLHYAVYAAFGALTSLYGHSENARQRIETQAVAGAALVLTLTVAAAFSVAQGPQWVLFPLLAAVVVGAGTLGTLMGWVPRGEIFFILVLLVVAGIPLENGAFLPTVAIGAGAAGFAVLLTVLEGEGAIGARSLVRSVRERAQAGLNSLDRLRHAVVILIAALAVVGAWGLALALGMGHPFWAPIAASALMPALTPADAMRRAIHMLSGTLGGVAIAALLFAQQPGPLALILMIALCQAVAELFLARNYAIALLFITPLAIGMSNLGRNLAWSPLLIDRLAEAALGAAVALAAIALGGWLLPLLAGRQVEREA